MIGSAACQHGVVVDVVEVGEVRRLLAVRSHGKGADHGVDLAQIEGVEEAAEGEVGEFDLYAQPLAHLARQGDVEAV